jgi:hypothetical protein
VIGLNFVVKLSAKRIACNGTRTSSSWSSETLAELFFGAPIFFPLIFWYYFQHLQQWTNSEQFNVDEYCIWWLWSKILIAIFDSVSVFDSSVACELRRHVQKRNWMREYVRTVEKRNGSRGNVCERRKWRGWPEVNGGGWGFEESFMLSK